MIRKAMPTVPRITRNPPEDSAERRREEDDVKSQSHSQGSMKNDQNQPKDSVTESIDEGKQTEQGKVFWSMLSSTGYHSINSSFRIHCICIIRLDIIDLVSLFSKFLANCPRCCCSPRPKPS